MPELLTDDQATQTLAKLTGPCCRRHGPVRTVELDDSLQGDTPY